MRGQMKFFRGQRTSAPKGEVDVGFLASARIQQRSKKAVCDQEQDRLSEEFTAAVAKLQHKFQRKLQRKFQGKLERKRAATRVKQMANARGRAKKASWQKSQAWCWSFDYVLNSKRK